MTPEEKLDRAHRAEKILADPVFNESWELVRQTILTNLENAPIRDKSGAHECRVMLKLLKATRSHIEQAVRDGKVVVHMLEERKRAEKFRKEEERRLSPADYSATFRR
jgi:hypothetical protein